MRTQQRHLVGSKDARGRFCAVRAAQCRYAAAFGHGCVCLDGCEALIRCLNYSLPPYYAAFGAHGCKPQWHSPGLSSAQLDLPVQSVLLVVRSFHCFHGNVVLHSGQGNTFARSSRLSSAPPNTYTPIPERDMGIDMGRISRRSLCISRKT